MFIALTTLYGSAQLLACTFNFFNDTDARVLLIDAQQVVHMIAPNTQEEIVGAIGGNDIEISELEQSSYRTRAQYLLTELECTVDGKPIATVRFSDIKARTENAWLMYRFIQEERRFTKRYHRVPFSIAGSTQEFVALRVF